MKRHAQRAHSTGRRSRPPVRRPLERLEERTLQPSHRPRPRLDECDPTSSAYRRAGRVARGRCAGLLPHRPDGRFLARGQRPCSYGTDTASTPRTPAAISSSRAMDSRRRIPTT